LTVEAQKICSDALFEGAIAIDATAGNGWDTQFLAERVGAKGRVYAIDLQASAIERAKTRLQSAGLEDRVQWHVGCHARLEQIVAPEHRGHVACIMFNLGYLPHSDKSTITRAETTMPAVRAALDWLAVDGCMSILAYVGHAGGGDEAEQIGRWLETLSDGFEVQRWSDATNPDSPILWAIHRRR
jgi:predicted methyltransferase